MQSYYSKYPKDGKVAFQPVKERGIRFRFGQTYVDYIDVDLLSSLSTTSSL
jgi:hypothetical protein